MTAPPTTSSCRRCGQVKSRSEFWPNPAVSTGLSSWCKNCQRAATRESREKHRERYNGRRRKPKQTGTCAEPGCEETFESAIPHSRRLPFLELS
jgi:hypothetical protein